MAVEQAEALGLADARVVVEPVGRDTAPAILAAALMLEDTPEDLMLVAPSDHVMTDVKGVVDTLRQAGNAQADEYPRFYRPWGWYETLCLDTRFQVKRIMVKPGGVLSLGR